MSLWQVKRLRRTLGIVYKRKRRVIRTTDSNHALPIAPNLLERNFAPGERNRVWVSDITYTQVDLAAALGVSQPTVSLAMRNGSMPGRWLLTALRLKQVNPDWILSGEGPQYLVAREGCRL